MKKELKFNELTKHDFNLIKSRAHNEYMDTPQTDNCRLFSKAFHDHIRALGYVIVKEEEIKNENPSE